MRPHMVNRAPANCAFIFFSIVSADAIIFTIIIHKLGPSKGSENLALVPRGLQLHQSFVFFKGSVLNLLSTMKPHVLHRFS